MHKRFVRLAGYISFIFALIYTRFVNIGWGLPYPFHPDERNMAVSMMSLSPSEWYNPHFFAYGQLATYAGYILLQGVNLLKYQSILPVTFAAATISLRVLSATASIATVWVLWRCFKLLSGDRQQAPSFILFLFLLLFSCAPFFVQFAHFGTTESLLMLLYVAITYLSLRLAEANEDPRGWLVKIGLLAGVAIAAKVSSVLFLALPLLVLLYVYWPLYREQQYLRAFFAAVKLTGLAVCVGMILSPYNLIDWQNFTSSMQYESDVALGHVTVFYTGVFLHTIPVIYQFVQIFPYALGWPVLVLFILSFVLLPYTRGYVILRLSFLLYFVPSAWVFTKWTRFMAPVFPIMVLLGLLYAWHLYTHIHARLRTKLSRSGLTIISTVILGAALLPGLAYVSIYTSPDTRFAASIWIFENLPADANILSETANVIDIPVPPPLFIAPPTAYRMASFNFYDVDRNPVLLPQLRNYLQTAQYIFVPSRRIFANYTCALPERPKLINRLNNLTKQQLYCDNLRTVYPILHAYYQNLFNGSFHFVKIKEFSQYPRITVFGKTIIEFPDEYADETWTVFDHPVVRIYEKR